MAFLNTVRTERYAALPRAAKKGVRTSTIAKPNIASAPGASEARRDPKLNVSLSPPSIGEYRSGDHCEPKSRFRGRTESDWAPARQNRGAAEVSACPDCGKSEGRRHVDPRTRERIGVGNVWMREGKIGLAALFTPDSCDGKWSSATACGSTAKMLRYVRFN